MRIVVDMQGAQSHSSRNRGIGRYTSSFVNALLKLKPTEEILLVVNGAFPESIVAFRRKFEGIIAAENIRVWYPIQASSYLKSIRNNWNRLSSSYILDAFIASLHPDIVLITSVFEGYVEDCHTISQDLKCKALKSAIFYDLIPYIHKDIYLKDANARNWYEDRLDLLKSLDLHLAISSSSAQESIDFLGTTKDRAINISSAVDPRFCPVTVSSDIESQIRLKYGLSRSYILYTGGIDHRKNIEGLIGAYAKLPLTIRDHHQLAIVCSIADFDKLRLLNLVKMQGLKNDEVIFTGFVSDEDIVLLYNLCKVFVFPSWHEGFGLPVLEAMSCGRAVIASNTSSLPEVVGCSEALFDPHDIDSITEKLVRVLTDEPFRTKLEKHALVQSNSFSWENTAKSALEALRVAYEKKQFDKAVVNYSTDTAQVLPLKLAFLSPLPPERSGIADYSADLLPELAKFYEIDLILNNGRIGELPPHLSCFMQRSIEWFRENAHTYDRIIYHFGNSIFHQHMFSLIEEWPGIVVLHDFFLSGILADMELRGFQPGAWVKSIYHSHGYKALYERGVATDLQSIIYKYPCNLGVLQNARGVIIHSETSRQLAKYWYDSEYVFDDWHYIPLLRKLSDRNVSDNKVIKERLGVLEDSFVVCSFGMIGPTKCTHRIIEAFLESSILNNKNVILILVGEIPQGQYGADLIKNIKESSFESQIKITGWVNAEAYQSYLQIADVGIQLRTASRGETSAAALDCLNYGLATIVNAHGSMVDLPDDVVWKLKDHFTNTELAEAISTLYHNNNIREHIGQLAKEYLKKYHSPSTCSLSYYKAIEASYIKANAPLPQLIDKIASISIKPKKEQLIRGAESIDRTIQQNITQRQLLVDISGLCVRPGPQTDIEHAVCSILNVWLHRPPKNYRVEPVYASKDDFGYRYARKITFDFMRCPAVGLYDDVITYRAGDIFIVLNFQPQVQVAQEQFYLRMQAEGVIVNFVVFDILPILYPEYFDVEDVTWHHKWLSIVFKSDAAICISNSVERKMLEYKKNIEPSDTLLEHFNLGYIATPTIKSLGIPKKIIEILSELKSKKTFIMVGSIEPINGCEYVLSAFNVLWQKNHDVNLVIVGKMGRMRTAFADTLSKHSERQRHLFWYEAVSEECLDLLYDASCCLIAASYGEGFGRPLVEAAQRNLPIFARDIPVFREVTKTGAYFFDASTEQELADEIEKWIALYQKGLHPLPDKIHMTTWQESADNLLNVLLLED